MDEAAPLHFLAQITDNPVHADHARRRRSLRARVEPALREANGTWRENASRMCAKPSRGILWQWWSAAAACDDENRQQAGRWVTLRQADALKRRKLRRLRKGDNDLFLKPGMKLPRGVEAD